MEQTKNNCSVTLQLTRHAWDKQMDYYLFYGDIKESKKKDR